jgi:hypothetical protein
MFMMAAPEAAPLLEAPVRVEFAERPLEGGLLLLIAEWNGSEWECWGRDSWEVTWGMVPATRDRIDRAEQLVQDSISCARNNEPKGA